ncbi:MAG: hypothetical protein QM820_60645 [Minicystis sp.]
MAGNTVAGTIVNDTGDTLALDAGATAATAGAFGPAPPAQCDQQGTFACVAAAGGVQGTIQYSGPNGSLTLRFNNPTAGANEYDAVATGSYDAGYYASQGRDATVTYRVRKKPTGPGDHDGLPSAIDADPPAEDHSHQGHVPVRGGIVVLSPKTWLIDVAWLAVNHQEWDQTILELTENRHGIKPSEPGKSAAPCPGELPDFTRYGIKAHGPCPGGAAHDYFYSWCGDYVSWVFWKAWIMKQEKGLTVAVGKPDLGKIFNREALNGTWVEGENLNKIESYAKGGGPLLTWHDPKDGFMPQRGDIYFLNRAGGGHVGIIDTFDATPRGDKRQPFYEYVTLDGKSFDYADPAHGDPGWLKTAAQAGVAKVEQGVAQTHRATNKGELVRGYVDASKLRQALGYR